MDLTVSKKDILMLILAVAFCLCVGAISGLTAPSMDIYADLKTPPLSPPGILFPIMWTILYILMGISIWMMYRTSHNMLFYTLFGLQLALNFIWTPLYFTWGFMTLAFIDLVLLWIAVAVMMYVAYKENVRISMYLLIPYILWLTFAAYLNLGTILLN